MCRNTFWEVKNFTEPLVPLTKFAYKTSRAQQNWLREPLLNLNSLYIIIIIIIVIVIIIIIIIFIVFIIIITIIINIIIINYYCFRVYLWNWFSLDPGIQGVKTWVIGVFSSKYLNFFPDGNFYSNPCFQ